MLIDITEKRISAEFKVAVLNLPLSGSGLKVVRIVTNDDTAKLN